MSKKAFFAVQLWGYEIDILSLFEKLEELGYDAGYYGDGPFNWLLDCFTVLAVASSKTSKIRIGPAVTYLEGSYRHPISVIKALFTIARLSNNRLDARFGFIKEEAKEYWSRFGINIPKVKERIDKLEEVLIIMKELMNKGFSSFKGKYYELNVSDFKPLAKVPICISAMSKRTIEIALKYAEIWELSYLPPEMLKIIIDKYSDKIRNIEISLELDVIVGRNEEDFRKKFNEYLKIRKTEKEELFIKSAISGTPEKCIRKIEEYLDLGVKRFTLAFNELPNLEGIKIFAKEVIPSF
jgi:alkanesulfonate monooxygenase SsuD/methylene tetrahydromethanopterin reductase-like flavin-dependent oxidoreductase (luciferase family)